MESPASGSKRTLPICSKEYWAYDFACDQPMEAILAALNSAGPWQWVMGDSSTYGDYLNCRPQEHVRVRLHEYPQMLFVGSRRGKGFSALLEIRIESVATQIEIDDVFRRSLQEIDATNIREIEPYD
jgi:hypothetical protein